MSIFCRPTLWGKTADGVAIRWPFFYSFFLFLAVTIFYRLIIVAMTHFVDDVPTWESNETNEAYQYLKTRDQFWQKQLHTNLWLQDTPCAEEN